MSSEWMKVMLEEIARKKAEEADARAEAERRGEASAPTKSDPSPSDPARGA